MPVKYYLLLKWIMALPTPTVIGLTLAQRGALNYHITILTTIIQEVWKLQTGIHLHSQAKCRFADFHETRMWITTLNFMKISNRRSFSVGRSQKDEESMADVMRAQGVLFLIEKESQKLSLLSTFLSCRPAVLSHLQTKLKSVCPSWCSAPPPQHWTFSPLPVKVQFVLDSDSKTSWWRSSGK